MRYNAKDAIACLPAGTYDATVEAVTETTSKSGKEMLVVSYRIYKPNGGDTALKDYVVNPNGLWRLKRLAKAIGKTAEFESGVFRESDYVGSNLKLDLDVEEDEQYGDKNRIAGWVSKDAAPSPQPAAATKPPAQTKKPAPGGMAYTPVEEEDIPFDVAPRC